MSSKDFVRNKRVARLQAMQAQAADDEGSKSQSALEEQLTRSDEKMLSKSKSSVQEQPKLLQEEPDSLHEKPESVLEKPESVQENSETLLEWSKKTTSLIFEVEHNNSILESLLDNINVDTIDSVLVLKLSETEKNQPQKYLLGCWSRLVQYYKAKTTQSSKAFFFNECRRLIVSYSGILISDPKSFNSECNEASFVDIMLSDTDSSIVTMDFMTHLISNFRNESDPPNLGHILEIIINDIQQRSMLLRFSGDWSQMTRIWIFLTSFKDICNCIVNHLNFIPETDLGSKFEKTSLLGPLFSLLPLSDAVNAVEYFGSTEIENEVIASRIVSTTRLSVNVLKDQLFLICDHIIRASEFSRTRLLKFFATAINLNLKKRAMQIDATVISSDAFLVSITFILLRFCEPIIKNLDKIDKIDTDYYKNISTYIDISNETKLSADQQESEEYYKIKVAKKVNFISHIFFLTISSFYYGIDVAFISLSNIDNTYIQLRRHLSQLEADRPLWASTPRAMILNLQLQHMKTTMEHAKAHRIMYETVLADPEQISKCTAFIDYLATWILRLVDPNHKYPSEILHLPILLDPAEQFKYYPELLIELVAEFNLKIARHSPSLFVTGVKTEIPIFSLTFISTSYAKNPYLKAKLVELLYCGVSLRMHNETPPITEILNTMPFALENLVHTLMQFYIEVENTGRSTQFYDKVNIRFHISQIFKAIWPNGLYHQKLAQESRDNIDFYVQFVALLLNDVTYLLDEALAKLEEIKNLESQPPPDVADSTQEEIRERIQHVANLERQALAYNQLGNETVDTLEMFTGKVPDAFVTPEIVERLAAMLDFNLNALCGPKCTNLKVRDAQKYKFNPKALLGTLIKVFLNLRHKPEFVLAIARDGRSYKKAMFEKALSIIAKFSVLPLDSIKQFEELIVQVEKAISEVKDGEESLGDIPEEFLDPLMFTIMQRPVILPSSKISIDLSTIKAHLLSDHTDPFNRMPLKLEDIEPNTELEKKIQEFLKIKRKRPTIVPEAEIQQ